jgi:membrane protein implicated in regulation of membrane protease activity
MFYLFIICAVLGGTIMVGQMVLTLVGALGDAGGDGGHGFGGDAHDSGGDFHADAHDVSGNGHEGDVHSGEGHDSQTQAHVHDHGSSVFFRMLSIRTLVAALAFFGLAGLAAHAAEWTQLGQLVVALLTGFAAMYGVFWVMQALGRLRSEGTIRIQRAVGKEASVYLRIPAERRGAGKVHVQLQHRTMEYAAVTAGPEVRTGEKVIVIAVIGPDTLEVEPIAGSQPAIQLSERTTHA